MKSIILYGLGKTFKKLIQTEHLIEWLESYGYTIIGLADGNSDNLKNVIISNRSFDVKKIEGYTIENVDCVVITTQKYFTEIKQDLIKKNVASKKIVSLDSFIENMVNPDCSFKYSLAIAAILKDEAEYIEEWICFHLNQGVEHFYLYDNESKDDIKLKLKNYIDKGIVTYVYWPGLAQQYPAYRNAIENFKNEVRYLCFIDIDEFIFQKCDGKGLPEVISDIQNEYMKNRNKEIEKKFAAVGINWLIFGTNFKKEKENGLVIERFLRCDDDKLGGNAHIKTIYNPRAVTDIYAHNGEFIYGYACISQNGSEIPGAYFRDSNNDKIAIHHYASKSEAEYVKRKLNGDVNNLKWIQQEENILKMLEGYKTTYNKKENKNALKYVNQVKKLIDYYR